MYRNTNLTMAEETGLQVLIKTKFLFYKRNVLNLSVSGKEHIKRLAAIYCKLDGKTPHLNFKRMEKAGVSYRNAYFNGKAFPYDTERSITLERQTRQNNQRSRSS